MKKYAVVSGIALAMLLSACKGGENGGPVPPVSAELTLNGLSDDSWTYFSFEKGETVGTSTFGSEEEDKDWAARTDWDFAISGDYLKTNGGDSGTGSGALHKDTRHNFETLSEAPEDGYETDVVQIYKK